MPGLMLIFYFTALVAYMGSNSFYDALLPDIASRGSSDKLSSLSYAWGYVGGVIPFLVCLGVSLLLKDAVTAAIRFAFVAAAAWWIALAIPMFRFVKERRRKEVRRANALDGFRKLWRTACEVRQHRDAALFLVAYFLYIDGVGTILMMAAPISVDIGIPQGWAAADDPRLAVPRLSVHDPVRGAGEAVRRAENAVCGDRRIHPDRRPGRTDSALRHARGRNGRFFSPPRS